MLNQEKGNTLFQKILTLVEWALLFLVGGNPLQHAHLEGSGLFCGESQAGRSWWGIAFHNPHREGGEMKAQVLLTAFVVLVVCTACAGAAAAPVPTPTPVGTPDPVWADLLKGLGENVWVCLKSETQFEARIPTGQLTVVNFHWVNTADGMRIHTARVTEETLTREGLGEYETFLFDSEVALGEFARVVVHVEIGSREWELWFPVGWCAPPTASQL